MIPSLQLILQLSWVISISACYCSAFLQNNQNYNGILHKAVSRPSFLTLNAQSNDEGNTLGDNVPNPVVTKETFLRDLLRDPEPAAADVSVQKKRKKGKVKEYRTFDNRDSLPFAVQVTTPDPYTHPDTKEKLAKSNKVPVRRNDAIEQSSIASSVYTKTSGGDSKNNKNAKDDDCDYTTKLGEFALDKHTATGDLLNVGDIQYKVVRLKCQYKYSGGGRFVMVRKILQVKEVGRLETEESLLRQWKQQSSSDDASKE